MRMHISNAEEFEGRLIGEIIEKANGKNAPPVKSIDGFVVGKVCGRIVGCADLEVLGRYGLLKSVASDPTYQKRGVGTQIVNQILKKGRDMELREVYLFTMGSEKFFEKIGFAKVEREDLPLQIQRSNQYKQICPDTAIPMRYSLMS